MTSLAGALPDDVIRIEERFVYIEYMITALQFILPLARYVRQTNKQTDSR